MSVSAGALCWGSNSNLEIDSTGGQVLIPTPVAESQVLSHVFGGAGTTCGLDEAGAALCWGSDEDGRLGSASTPGERCDLGSIPCSSQPLPVQGGHGFRTLSPGRWSTCGITVDDALYCWGSNRFGQLGDGSTAEWSSVPVKVADPQTTK